MTTNSFSIKLASDCLVNNLNTRGELSKKVKEAQEALDAFNIYVQAVERKKCKLKDLLLEIFSLAVMDALNLEMRCSSFLPHSPETVDVHAHGYFGECKFYFSALFGVYHTVKLHIYPAIANPIAYDQVENSKLTPQEFFLGIIYDKK